MTTLVLVVGISLATSFLCSILEAVLLSVTPSYVAVLRERGERAGEILHRFQIKIDEPIAAILTLNTIANTFGAALGGAIAQRVFGNQWLTAFSVVLTLAVLILAEIIPKTIGASFWKQLVRPAAYVLRGLVTLMRVVLIPLSLIQRLLTSKNVGPTISRAEIAVLAEIGRREGTLDEDEWQVMSKVMRLDEVTVGSVMTPRIDMVAVPAGATVDEAMNLMLEEGHLRLPVYREDLDHIVGILLARDLWQAAREGFTHVQDIVRPAQFAPATKPVEELIPEMRRHRAKMSIVVDDFGGTAGLVTLEDLIEEIIGEIQDEHEDDEPADFQALEDGRVRVWGGVPLRDVNERLDLALEEEIHETLAGYLFGKLDRIGRVGDEIPVPGGRFRIIGMRGRRIEFIIFEPNTTRPNRDD